MAVEAYDALAPSTFSNVEYFVLDNAHIAFGSDVGSFSGLTLIAPVSSSITYLIDDFGEVKHQWQNSSSPRLSAYLLPKGNLLRTGDVATGLFDSGGKDGAIEELDWDGKAVWNLSCSDATKTLHRYIEPLGIVVWRWDVFDHLDELGLEPNQANTEDWLHLNSIVYN